MAIRDFSILEQKIPQFLMGTVSKLMVIAWLLISVIAFRAGCSDQFQRAGSIGVASIIISFSLIAWQVDIGIRALKEKSDGSIFASYVIDKGEDFLADVLSSDQETAREKLNEVIARDKQEIDQSVDFDVFVNLFQVILLSLATIQWGYGDLIVNFFQE